MHVLTRLPLQAMEMGLYNFPFHFCCAAVASVFASSLGGVPVGFVRGLPVKYETRQLAAGKIYDGVSTMSLAFCTR